MKRTLAVFFVALLLLAAVIFLPMYQPLGGTFNFKADLDFFDVFNFLVNRGDTASSFLSWSSWPVIFTLAAIIPAILLLIFSICGSKALCIISSIMGILGMAYTLFLYKENCGSLGAFFGEYANISIGLWIVVALFILALILSIAAPKKVKKAKKA